VDISRRSQVSGNSEVFGGKSRAFIRDGRSFDEGQSQLVLCCQPVGESLCCFHRIPASFVLQSRPDPPTTSDGKKASLAVASLASIYQKIEHLHRFGAREPFHLCHR